MDKSHALRKIAKEIKSCKKCRAGKMGKMVFGEGDPNAKIVFVGEAPGKTEAETGRPFVGRSGKLLRSLIHKIGLKEEDVYVTSPVKYLPKSGTPSPSDIEHSRPYFERQLMIINPEVVVLLGSVAVLAVLGEKIPVSRNHGQVIKKNRRIYFVTLHPAGVLRFPPRRKDLLSDFQKLKDLVGNF